MLNSHDKSRIETFFFGIDQFFETIFQLPDEKVEKYVVSTFTLFQDPKEPQIISTEYFYVPNENRSKHVRSVAFNFSLVPEFFIALLVIPILARSYVQKSFKEGKHRHEFEAFLPIHPLLIRFRRKFPTLISGTFTSYQPKQFLKGDIISIDSSFKSSICFCDCPCFLNEKKGKHCAINEAYAIIYEKITIVDKSSNIAEKCIEVLKNDIFGPHLEQYK